MNPLMEKMMEKLFNLIIDGFADSNNTLNKTLEIQNERFTQLQTAIEKINS
jgi:hypothetical protein